MTPLRDGWRDATTVADDGLRARCWFVNSEGFARTQEVGALARTREECEQLLDPAMERAEQRILEEGGTLVHGDWPEGTKFDPVPENIFGEVE